MSSAWLSGLYPERGVLYEKVFLTFLQNWHKRPVPESFFNEVADLSLKKETMAQVFTYEFYEIFKNNFFAEQLRKAAFVCYKLPQSIVIVV